MTKPFTGWHMATILVGFFGIVIAVNVYMARAAIKTFGGTVVDNSYVASQEFNGWLAAAHKQERLGWDTRLSLVAGRHVRIEATKAGAARVGMRCTTRCRSATGRSEPPAAPTAITKPCRASVRVIFTAAPAKTTRSSFRV